MTLIDPIQYMVDTDFTSDGRIKSHLDREPLFVMIQSSRCMYCEQAKPALQKLADSGMVRVMTIQVDGEYDGERRLAKMMDTVYPNMRGYPSYMLFTNGRKIPYEGRRDYESLKEFIRKTK